MFNRAMTTGAEEKIEIQEIVNAVWFFPKIKLHQLLACRSMEYRGTMLLYPARPRSIIMVALRLRKIEFKLKERHKLLK
jgi:hypothetical protein